MVESDTHTTLRLPVLTPAARVLIVCAPYYRAIADGLISGATATLEATGAHIEMVEVPGALEIPVAIRLIDAEQPFDGYVALGCVIRGETTHYETVCNDSARGLMMLGVDRGLCIGNGILTCENMAQAEARANPEDMNKGGGAAGAALHLIALARRYAPQTPPLPTSPEDLLLAGGTGLNRTA